MPDISMCEGGECPLRNKCYRYRAEPDDMLQSYYTMPPYEGNSCDRFWPMEKKCGPVREVRDIEREKQREEDAKDDVK